MSQPYVGEVRVFAFPFAPRSYTFCNGQLLAISQYEVLYTIIGTTFGGNGTTTFAVPNMSSNSAMHWGNGTGLTPRVIGQTSGAPNVTLTTQQIPNHTHMVLAANTTTAAQQSGTPTSSAYVGPSAPANAYDAVNAPSINFSPKMIANSGSSLPHPNVQPVLAMNFCIALFGIFPSRS
jgi:microcystin-dependent protein